MAEEHLPKPALAVIFDLDGTLLNTLDDLADAVNHVLGELGCPIHPVDAYRWMVGDGAPKLIERALPAERIDELHAQAFDGFREFYAAQSQVKTRPYEGVPELLDELEARSIPKSIVSNKPDGPTRELVADIFGRWGFVSLSGQREDIPKKPDPAMALEAAGAMGVAAERCLFVGDSNIDIRTGHNAGMTTIGVSWGFRGREELVAEGASAIIDDPLELLSFLRARAPR